MHLYNHKGGKVARIKYRYTQILHGYRGAVIYLSRRRYIKPIYFILIEGFYLPGGPAVHGGVAHDVQMVAAFPAEHLLVNGVYEGAFTVVRHRDILAGDILKQRDLDIVGAGLENFGHGLPVPGYLHAEYGQVKLLGRAH